jgi:hypothetical protein
VKPNYFKQQQQGVQSNPYYEQFVNEFRYESQLDVLSNNNPLQWRDVENMNAIEAVAALNYYYSKSQC